MKNNFLRAETSQWRLLTQKLVEINNISLLAFYILSFYLFIFLYFISRLQFLSIYSSLSLYLSLFFSFSLSRKTEKAASNLLSPYKWKCIKQQDIDIV